VSEDELVSRVGFELGLSFSLSLSLFSHFSSPSFVRLVNVLKHFSLFSTLVTFKIFKIFKTTTCFGLNWPSSGVNTGY
jgi:hypothetical protein